jgi:hypothetical protein
MQTEKEYDHKIVEKAISLSIVEVGLGSIVHALKVPIGGHLLSLNQGLFLIRSNDQADNRKFAFKLPFEISMIVAMMKSLSPAGRKFGPMMSIGMQGLLFGIGNFIGANSLLGHILGMCLLSVWAFIQPLISYWLIYGQDIIKAIDYLVLKLNKYVPVTTESLLEILMLLIFLKALVASLLALVAKYIPEKYLLFYDQALLNLNDKKIKRKKSNNEIIGALKDMFNPLFILSTIMMFSFFFVTEEKWVIIFWKALRVFAIAFLIFYLSRAKWFYSFLLKLGLKNKYVNRLVTLSENAYKKIVNFE